MSRVPLAAHILRRTLPVMILIAAAGATCELARAEYPERQITMIVCFPAGGGPHIREKFVKAGLPVVAEGPEIFRARIAREVPMYKDIIDKAGLKIQ